MIDGSRRPERLQATPPEGTGRRVSESGGAYLERNIGGRPATWWVPAGPLTGLAEDGVVHADLGGLPVCLARSGGTVHALLDECSHGQVALSDGDGDVEAGYVECWLHGSRFDLATGRPTGPPATRPVPVYPVRVVNGVVEVALPTSPAPTTTPPPAPDPDPTSRGPR